MADFKGYYFGADGIVLDDYSINYTATPYVVNAAGSGASGSATIVMPFRGTYFKRIIIYLNNFKNTGSAINWTIPVPFSYTPVKSVDSGTSGITVSATQITFPGSMGTAVTGWVIIEGF